MTSLVFSNIGELTTNDPTVGDESMMGRIKDAALVIEDGRIMWTGAAADAPSADSEIDVEGSAIIPGFVDSHTHLVFAGERSEEFAARMAGERYDGGGIATTVTATRSASTTELRDTTQTRLDALRAYGVTTVEMKSGYDLTLEGEVRLCEIAREFTEETTFLGAHVVPSEFTDRRDDYVALVAGAMLDRCAPLVRWADVFCDQGAFSVEEARLILSRAKGKGLGLRLHGNQLGHTGGIQLAVELDAASVDHCTHVSDLDIEALAGSQTVATLLPGAEFSTKSEYPSGRHLLDAGVSVALATDCNPGTSYVTNMGLIIALAVREMGLTVDEALYATTMGGAKALRRPDIGHLRLGAKADLAILSVPKAAHFAYQPGASLVRAVHIGGETPGFWG
jgi:imidazolonepropionase